MLICFPSLHVNLRSLGTCCLLFQKDFWVIEYLLTLPFKHGVFSSTTFLFVDLLFLSMYRVTNNLLAMARPSTEIIEKYNVIEQFQRYLSCFSLLLFFMLIVAVVCCRCTLKLFLIPRKSVYAMLTCYNMMFLHDSTKGVVWRRSLTCRGQENMPAVVTHWTRRVVLPIALKLSWRLAVSSAITLLFLK